MTTPRPTRQTRSSAKRLPAGSGLALDFFTSTSARSKHPDDFYEPWDHSLVLDYGRERRAAEREYLQDIELFMDLRFELTAAGDHVCDAIRDQLDGAFRLGAGRLSTSPAPARELAEGVNDSPARGLLSD